MLKLVLALVLVCTLSIASSVLSLSVSEKYLALSTGFHDAIRSGNFLSPPAAARAFAIVHTCAYDAWSSFDSEVRDYRWISSCLRSRADPAYVFLLYQALASDQKFASLSLKWPFSISESLVFEAIAAAMHRCGLFILEGRPASEIAIFNSSFTSLGISINSSLNLDGNSPVGIGNILLACPNFFAAKISPGSPLTKKSRMFTYCSRFRNLIKTQRWIKSRWISIWCSQWLSRAVC